MSFIDPSALHAPNPVYTPAQGVPSFPPYQLNDLQSHQIPPQQAQRAIQPPGSSVGKVKSAKPAYKESPVKAACLTCRAKKAKCDGIQPVCGACAKKSLECQYVKSRRGGARKKRQAVVPSALQEFLKKLDGLLGIPDFKVVKGMREPTDDTTNIVREFTSREEIFRCYYNDVHPFVPVMPPRKYLPEILPTLLPVSPFLLAVQTILVLVPHPNDPEPASADSKRLRSAASHSFAQLATEAVERLVETNQTSLECVQALTILALWEWGSTGSTDKNRGRSTQASQIAMDMGLHDMDKYSDNKSNRALEGIDWRKDMARRTWWQTFVNQLTSAVITGTTPILSADDERVHVDYPVCSEEDEAWPRWIETNRQCTRVFGIVNTVYYSHLMPGDGAAAWGAHVETTDEEKKAKMRKDILGVDALVTDMMRKAEETAIIDLVPGGEEEVVRNLQLSARLGLSVVHIHIHRHQAFPEVSLFSKMICGLPKMPEAESSTVSNDPSPKSGTDDHEQYDFIEDMWQPETYPESLPEPWFAHTGGAGALYAPTSESPKFQAPVAASITSYHSPDSTQAAGPRRPSVVSTSSNKPHKAWGVDEHDKPDAKAEPQAPAADPSTLQLFPPGVSLARLATAAHTVVRLEVLHRSAVIAMWDGPPKWMPFCACGLVTGAYSFLLLALAVQAESLYTTPTEEAVEQINGLLTNVKVIVAGLEAYGTMWAGIDVMASEVRAALEAATRLPIEVRQQIDLARAARSSQTPPFQTTAPQIEYTGSADYAYPVSDITARLTELSPSSSGDERSLSVEGNTIPGNLYADLQPSNIYGYTGPLHSAPSTGVPDNVGLHYGYAQQAYAFPPQSASHQQYAQPSYPPQQGVYQQQPNPHHPNGLSSEQSMIQGWSG